MATATGTATSGSTDGMLKKVGSFVKRHPYGTTSGAILLGTTIFDFVNRGGFYIDLNQFDSIDDLKIKYGDAISTADFTGPSKRLGAYFVSSAAKVGAGVVAATGLAKRLFGKRESDTRTEYQTKISGLETEKTTLLGTKNTLEKEIETRDKVSEALVIQLKSRDEYIGRLERVLADAALKVPAATSTPGSGPSSSGVSSSFKDPFLDP